MASVMAPEATRAASPPLEPPGACRWPKGLGPAVQLIVGFVVGQQLGDVALDQRGLAPARFSRVTSGSGDADLGQRGSHAQPVNASNAERYALRLVTTVSSPAGLQTLI